MEKNNSPIILVINGPILMITPLKLLSNNGNIYWAFSVHTKEFNITFSLDMADGKEMYSPIRKVQDHFISSIVSSTPDPYIAIHEDELYFKIDGDTMIYHIKMTIERVQLSSINPSIPILNGLK